MKPDFIPDRLNEQPAVMRGCSWPELSSIVKESIWISIPLALVLAIGMDMYSSMIASVPAFIGIVFYIKTGRMARIKNGRPVGYFVISSKLKKQRRGFLRIKRKDVYVEHDGHWKISKD